MEREQGLQPASYAVTASYCTALANLLRKEFPQIEIRAVDTLLERLKASKTKVQLEKMRVGANIAATRFGAMREAIRPNLREAEVAGLLQMAFERNTLDAQMQTQLWIFLLHVWTQLRDGRGCFCPHPPERGA